MESTAEIIRGKGSVVAGNPVVYAEHTLKVHAVYEKALEELDRYEVARGALVSAQSALRFAREELADHEADFTVICRGENPKLSATAFDRMLKVSLQQDSKHRDLRRHIAELQEEVDSAELDVKTLDRRLEVAVSRMNELAGLLTFYAARLPRS